MSCKISYYAKENYGLFMIYIYIANIFSQLQSLILFTKFLQLHFLKAESKEKTEFPCTAHTCAETGLRLKSYIRNSSLVSYVGSRDPKTWAITCCFPGRTLAGSWNQERSQDLHPDILLRVAASSQISYTLKYSPLHFTKCCVHVPSMAYNKHATYFSCFLSLCLS